MVFLRLPFKKGVKCLSFENDIANGEEIRQHITSKWGIEDFKLYYNGKLLEHQHFVPRDAILQAAFSLPGGKGGFGSMLRAIGAQIEKTTNREACRDLSGRRLRDINEEQRLKKWISKESEREAEKARRRQARIERLKTKPKHNFVDFEYEKEISQLPERVDEALHAGMEKASKRPKAAEACSVPPTKKKKLWMDEDLSGSSDSDSPEATGSSDSMNSHTANAQSSRSEASECESSNDSHISEPKQDKNGSEIFGETSKPLNTTPEGHQDIKKDQTSVNLFVSTPSEAEALHETTTLNETGAQEQSSVAEKQTASNTNTETESFERNEGGKEKDPMCVEKIINTPSDSQHSDHQEAQIEDVDLSTYDHESELEDIGLERLKMALMIRGLKCGGTISDRAQRLWKIRGLEPHEYPSNLLAKKKN